MSFIDRLEETVERVGHPCLLGLDPHPDLLPDEFAVVRDPAAPRAKKADAMRAFCNALVDELADRLAVVKPQSAFFEIFGADGVRAFEDVVIHAKQRGLLVIGDVKRGDIASTARAYALGFLDDHQNPAACDAITVNPWLGTDAVEPFLEVAREHGKGVYVLVHTSNPGAAEFQKHGSPPVAELVARRVHEWGQTMLGSSGSSSVGAVVGATRGTELESARALMPATPFLLPGYGAQGATAADVLPAFDDPEHPLRGGVINSSRGIAFAYRRPEHEGKAWTAAASDAWNAMLHDVRGALTRTTLKG